MNKIIYFRNRTDTPLRVVKDKPRSGVSCALCFFKHIPDGCPTAGEEYRAGAGAGCCKENHHYEEAGCAS